VVVFVSGAIDDAGHWTGVADVLASACTVVTYDRRGNSRSPRPPEWTATTIDEQADDAAALLGALGVEQAIVLGTSAAAGIVANLALRHDSVLRGVVIHEPLFQSGVTNADAVRAGPAFDDTEGDGDIVLASATGTEELKAAVTVIGRVSRLERKARDTDSGERITPVETAMSSQRIESP
jgi:pimeloyl-ACP methyl ester carboxylesterase